jgi:hypothetical protein
VQKVNAKERDAAKLTSLSPTKRRFYPPNNDHRLLRKNVKYNLTEN